MMVATLEKQEEKSIIERLEIVLGARVFLEWEEAPDEYRKSGLVRPQGAARESHYTGIVRHVGLDCEADDNGVATLRHGDRVFFDQFCSPVRFDDDGKRYAFVYERDILVKIPERVLTKAKVCEKCGKEADDLQWVAEQDLNGMISEATRLLCSVCDNTRTQSAA